MSIIQRLLASWLCVTALMGAVGCGEPINEVTEPGLQAEERVDPALDLPRDTAGALPMTTVHTDWNECWGYFLVTEADAIAEGAGSFESYERVSLDDLSDCDSIWGSVVIRDTTSITDLAPLSRLKQFVGLESAFGHGLDGLAGFVIYRNEGLTELRGLNSLETSTSLVIEENPALTSLDGLSSLRRVSWEMKVAANASLERLTEFPADFSIRTLEIAGHPQLTDISGLGDDASIEDLYTLADNPMLSDWMQLVGPQITGLALSRNGPLDDLSFLPQVVGLRSLGIAGQPELANLQGLEALTQMDALMLSDNANLRDLSGLENLTELGHLSLHGNARLQSLSALASLEATSISLWLSDNDMLESLSGLEGIRGVRNLYVQDNTRLQSLTGLDELRRVDEIMWVEDNPSLSSIGALSSLEMVGNHAMVRGNPQLPSCEVAAIAGSVGPQFFWFGTDDSAACE